MQFGMNCAKCHEGADVDGPPLTGGPFIDRWREDSLASLFSFIRTSMPRDAPGKLSEDAYRNILAYLLAANDYPAGKTELGADSIAATQLVGKDGPKPLPSNALVRVTGCLTQDVNSNWILDRAAAPARTREGDKITAEERMSAEAQSLGKLVFRLQNLDELPRFEASTSKGAKVQLKGALVHQSTGDRINVTTLEILAAAGSVDQPGCEICAVKPGPCFDSR
jgi:hypothetical protein